MPVRPAGFAAQVRALQRVQNHFDAEGAARQRAVLNAVAAMPLPRSAALAAWHDSLLFLAAHPADADMARRVDAALRRLASWLRTQHTKPALPAWQDQGMPWVDIVTRFSHDTTRRLMQHPGVNVTLDHMEHAGPELTQVLALTLPALERPVTTMGHDAHALLDALRVPKPARLRLIVDELAKLDDQPLIKDHLHDSLGLNLRLAPRTAAFCKGHNRLPLPRKGLYFQRDKLSRFDVRAMLDSPLPRARRMTATACDQAIAVLRDTMTLTIRETDPCTYLERRSLRVWDLERGLSCAFFCMEPARQMPLESYVGFTLFKNGLPVAYGGSWVFGTRADFGMNIFEPYRGGESGYMMTQVLRCYRQAFGIDHFEVDAHQFGLDNPDGIASGAYWFYHRHGFRSMNAELARLAVREKQRIDAGTGHRSSPVTLKRFTGANVALKLTTQALPVGVTEIAERVTQWIAREHRGRRDVAMRAALAGLARGAGVALPSLEAAPRALQESALAAAVTRCKDREIWRLWVHAAAEKAREPYAYQAVLRELVPRLA